MKKITFIIIFIILILIAGYFDFINARNSQYKHTAQQLAESNPEVNSYIKNIFYSISENWYPNDERKYSVELQGIIDSDGTLNSVTVICPSKNKDFEKSAMKAFIKASPFKQLPKNIRNEGLIIWVTFNEKGITISLPKKSQNTIVNMFDIRDKSVFCDVTSTDAPEMKHYARKIEQLIQANWNPPENFDSRVVVNFTINKDGSLKNIKAETSSKNVFVLNAAVNAIKRTQFERFPKSFDNENAQFRYTFMVFNNNGNKTEKGK